MHFCVWYWMSKSHCLNGFCFQACYVIIKHDFPSCDYGCFSQANCNDRGISNCSDVSICAPFTQDGPHCFCNGVYCNNVQCLESLGKGPLWKKLIDCNSYIKHKTLVYPGQKTPIPNPTKCLFLKSQCQFEGSALTSQPTMGITYEPTAWLLAKLFLWPAY